MLPQFLCQDRRPRLQSQIHILSSFLPPFKMCFRVLAPCGQVLKQDESPSIRQIIAIEFPEVLLTGFVPVYTLIMSCLRSGLALVPVLPLFRSCFRYDLALVMLWSHDSPAMDCAYCPRSEVYPIRNSSTSLAHPRPSTIFQTTRD